MIDEEMLTRVLSDFAHALANRDEVGDVLYRLAEHTVQVLPISAAGVSVVDPEGKLRPATPSGEVSTDLGGIEEAWQQGPGVDSFLRGDVVLVSDVDRTASRWPVWARRAGELGVRAAAAIPLWSRGESLGSVALYRSEPAVWRDAEIRVAQVLADMAASYVVNASELEASRRTADQLRQALETRVVIEQAKGFLASEQRISVDDAFDLLRHHARTHGASLRAVAEAVVALGLRPSPRTPRPKG